MVETLRADSALISFGVVSGSRLVGIGRAGSGAQRVTSLNGFTAQLRAAGRPMILFFEAPEIQEFPAWARGSGLRTAEAGTEGSRLGGREGGGRDDVGVGSKRRRRPGPGRAGRTTATTATAETTTTAVLRHNLLRPAQPPAPITGLLRAPKAAATAREATTVPALGGVANGGLMPARGTAPATRVRPLGSPFEDQPQYGPAQYQESPQTLSPQYWQQPQPASPFSGSPFPDSLGPRWPRPDSPTPAPSPRSERTADLGDLLADDAPRALAGLEQASDSDEIKDCEALEAAGWSFKRSSHPAIGKKTRRFFGGEPADGTIVAYIPEDGEDFALWKNQHDDDYALEDLELHELQAALEAYEQRLTAPDVAGSSEEEEESEEEDQEVPLPMVGEVTAQQSSGQAVGKTGYRGVYEMGSNYQVRIKNGKKLEELGTFTSTVAAAVAYNKRAKELKKPLNSISPELLANDDGQRVYPKGREQSGGAGQQAGLKRPQGGARNATDGGATRGARHKADADRRGDGGRGDQRGQVSSELLAMFLVPSPAITASSSSSRAKRAEDEQEPHRSAGAAASGSTFNVWDMYGVQRSSTQPGKFVG